MSVLVPVISRMAVLSRRIGIIIQRRNVGTNDRRITLFCVDGKHELRARGTQKLESKLAGSLEPLTLVEATTVRGRNGEQITGSTIRDSYRAIHGSVARIAGAGLLASAVDQLVHGIHDDHVPYRRVREAFVLIGRGRTNREVALAVSYGLWNLIATLGYSPHHVPLSLRPSGHRLVEVILQGNVRVVRRIRCTVRTARESVTEAVRYIERITDREVPAARFFFQTVHPARR